MIDQDSSTRTKTLLIVLLGATLVLLVGTWVGLKNLQYVVLDIEAPMAGQTRGTWYVEERAVRTWRDSGQRFFQWRRRALATDAKFNSVEELLEYTDKQMEDEGWTLHPSPAGICSNHFIETEFLPEGRGGFLGYLPEGADPDQMVPIACISAWVQSEEAGLFELSIQTQNPSLLTKLNSWFRRGSN